MMYFPKLQVMHMCYLTDGTKFQPDSCVKPLKLHQLMPQYSKGEQLVKCDRKKGY
jgi:hypothetical protein